MPDTAPTVLTGSPVPSPSPPSVLISKRKQKRARQVIGWIEPLRLAFPEFSVILDGAIEDLKTEAARNPETDRQLVLSAIHLGHWTISDLLEELPMKRKALQTIIDQLVAAKLLITKTPEIRNQLGGRPEILYLPAPNSLGK